MVGSEEWGVFGQYQIHICINARKKKIYKYLYSRCWDFLSQCRCVSTAANGSEQRVATAGADGREPPSYPYSHGGPNRNEFVFGGDPHGDSPPPSRPIRPAASGGGVGFHPSRAASTNVPTAFVLRGRRRRGRLLRPNAAAAPRQAESCGNIAISRATAA